MNLANGCQRFSVGLSWAVSAGGHPLLPDLCSAFQFGQVQLAAVSQIDFLLVTRFAQVCKVAAVNSRLSQVFLRGRNRCWTRPTPGCI